MVEEDLFGFADDEESSASKKGAGAASNTGAVVAAGVVAGVAAGSDVDADAGIVGTTAAAVGADADAGHGASSKDGAAPRRVFVVDGYGQIYRSYFAFITNPLKDKAGDNVSAVFGFFNIIMMLIRQYSPDYLIVAMDSKGRTFRHELYDKYKANRDKTPEDLHSQIPVIERILDAMRIPHYAQEGMEADDIVATICRNASRLGMQTVMVTGDKDLLQLVGDDVFALRPPRKGEKEYRLCASSDVKELFGVEPQQMVDYLTILGDSSDNVPGIDGIGEKGAVKLLTDYCSLDEAYNHIADMSKGVRAKLEAAMDHIGLSRTLITLKDDLFEMEESDFSSYTTDGIDWREGVRLFDEIGADRLSKAAARFIHSPSKAAKPSKAGESVLAMASEDPSSSVDGGSNPKAPKAERGDYSAVVTLEDLETKLSSIPDGSLVAFDLETTDVDEMKASPVGFSFAWEDSKAYYVPLVCAGVPMVPIDGAKDALSRHLPRFKVVGQNLKYDLKVLRRWGVDGVSAYADTMIMAWLDDSSSMRYNLDALAEKYLGYDTIRFEDVVPKGGVFSDVPLENAVQYGAEDSDIALRLFSCLLPRLEAKGLCDALFGMEMPLVGILAGMELEGIRLDPSRLDSFRMDLEGEIDEVQRAVFELCGKQFNLNSPRQLQEVLFVDRNLPTGKKTHSGFSTDSDVLEELSLSSDDPVPALILRYRLLNKLLNTYVLTLPCLVDASTGRIHTTFFQTGTATGRLSSKNPNLQNIPIRTDEGRRIRDAFVPREGCLLMSADYSQIELVVLAHISGDANLKAAFASGEDVHRDTAAKIFGVFPEMVTPDQRRAAKTINFGIMYGMSAFRLAKDLRIPRSEAQRFIDTYFEQYSGVKAFIEDVKEKAKADGFVKTAMGHVRAIPEMKSRNRAVLAGAERIAVNTIIQGTAAEIMKLAMISLSNEIASQGLKSRMLLQVHDEMIFEVPLDEVDRMEVLVRRCMEDAYSLSVPLKVGLETGRSWGEMH